MAEAVTLAGFGFLSAVLLSALVGWARYAEWLR